MATTKKIVKAEKNSFDMYANLSNIKGDKIVLTIDVQDNGQDVTWFVIEFYPDYKLGYVLSSGSYQKNIWRGKCVLSGKPKRGQKLLLSEAPGKAVIQLKHKITEIQEWPLHLYMLTAPAENLQYGDIEAVVTAAYSRKDALTIEPQYGEEFLQHDNLAVRYIGEPVDGTVRGIVIVSSLSE